MLFFSQVDHNASRCDRGHCTHGPRMLSCTDMLQLSSPEQSLATLVGSQTHVIAALVRIGHVQGNTQRAHILDNVSPKSQLQDLARR